ncbi:phage portal protein [Olivibacter sp. LS-1]|uniref:phage portal protein n=1 Tax=Olivibacter sp. LS-1 TaxID=2592345 RepID=UPI0011EB4F14|nr:phage portal protein [Olivibacter sp. LS-1]QEL01566.1 phage portal protein [Olivibacter sp. LS-1]
MAKKINQEVDEQQNDPAVDVNLLPLAVESIGRSVEPCYPTSDQEYDVMQHKVFDESKNERPRKRVIKPVLNDNGEQALTADGKKRFKIEYIDVNRIGIPLQKLIVKRRVAFMNVGKIQLEADPKNDNEQKLYDIVKKIRDDNKIEFVEKEVARRMLWELQVAKLWYTAPAEEGYWGDLAISRFRVRCKILSPSKGDTLLPVFDSYGDMIYFGRLYKVRRNINDVVSLRGYSDIDEERFDIYSKTHIYKFRRSVEGDNIVSTVGNNGWILESAKPHSYGKIPVIYYSKPAPPWADVQTQIARLETVISNFADTNDYHASPILVMTGEVGAKTLEKGEQGRKIQITGKGGDAKYVTWEHAPESVKLEIDTLVDFIYTCTQTPNISFKEMANLGAKSGVAFDRIFIDAHLAARDEIDGEYGMCTQRDINLLKSIGGVINTSLKDAVKTLEIGFDIPLYRINDDSETIATLMKANGNKPILSQQTSVEYSPYTKNAADELKLIEGEAKKAAEMAAANVPSNGTEE